ncbi:hypothetical protein BU24DRAFT_338768 [Aaosphaeria arxii CBS 175.79]|uniref:N(6)-L-threonylcarbamoyladenine synthase n=1 Tax=Aaosphaeria arxii CBS 175.79 TaxID=1450172 RepID=A0A6A5YB81_9PLEO|nr:uncharacterized protein BU24DRAFT_338768 [Aaosphaeria arxii CBS 175.79]KAF2021854.1 hypothetical protein BU24DRAFT_338768 [Aaosphaeria arxii CBS 175.79]
MITYPSALSAARAHVKLRSSYLYFTRRCHLTLAIETSCDDTSVALLDKRQLSNGKVGAKLLFHKKVTSNNTEYHGVHPLVSHRSHQENLADLVNEAAQHLPSGIVPDLICVTRGPGMRSNLSTGIDTAKGLAVAWQRPFLGVHHMQAHALTPRLVAALQNAQEANTLGSSEDVTAQTYAQQKPEPQFPFLSVLASGGHTILIHSRSLADHRILGSSSDIAIGQCLDKVARAVLPPELLRNARTTMYGALLEEFAFTELSAGNTKGYGAQSEKSIAAKQHEAQYSLEVNNAENYRAIYETRYAYTVPKNDEVARERNLTKWGWAFHQPLTKAGGGLKIKSLEMSFTGLMTAAERAIHFQTDPNTRKLTKVERSPEDVSVEERKSMAYEAMRAAFEHVSNRAVLALQRAEEPLSTIVLSGGVAANSFFRYILASTLCAQNLPDTRLVFPPPALCTDNAAMIAWAGLEMFEAGHIDSRKIRALRKWPLDQILTPSQDD